MEAAYFYKHAVLTGLKRVFGDTGFASKIRCGWETAPTGLWAQAIVFLKLTVTVRFETALTRRRKGV